MARVETRPFTQTTSAKQGSCSPTGTAATGQADPKVLSPTFSAGTPGSVEQSRAEPDDDFDFATFVAEHRGRVVGSTVGCALTKSGSYTWPMRLDNASFLGFAAVLPDARGLGAGHALGDTVLAWSGEAGYDAVVADWRQNRTIGC